MPPGYIPLRHFRPAVGNMFRSVQYTFTFCQGCGYINSVKPVCPYCWTQFMGKGISRLPKLIQKDFEALIPETIRDCVIFINSAHDTYAPIIPWNWIKGLHDWIGRQDPNIKFLLQSKWIHRAHITSHVLDLTKIKDRVIMATTLETTNQELLKTIGSRAPSIERRLLALQFFKDKGFRIRVSMEPIYRFKCSTMLKWMEMLQPELVEIGLDNWAHRHKLEIPQPDKMEVKKLYEGLLDLGVTVNLKESMEKWLQVWP